MIHNYYQQRGGEDESFETEVRQLRDSGVTVHTYVDSNDRIGSISHVRTALRASWSQESYRQITRRIQSLRPDILHVQNSFPLVSPSVYYAAKAQGIPVVQTLRNYRLLCPNAELYRDGGICEDCVGRRIAWPAIVHRCYRQSMLGSAAVTCMLLTHRTMRTWWNKVDAFITISDFARRKFIQGGLPADQIFVRPNYVYPDPGPSELPREFMLYVGRLSPVKGIQTLLRAWELLPDPIPLVIVGDGSLSAEVARAAEQSEVVSWLGSRSSDDVLDLMGRARGLLLPSEWYEPFGRVAIEAYAVGTPVIATDIGSLSEVVEHGVSGYLVPSESPDSLASAVRRMWDDPTSSAEMGRNGRRLYLDRYTARSSRDALIDIYSCALARSTPRSGRPSSPATPNGASS